MRRAKMLCLKIGCENDKPKKIQKFNIFFKKCVYKSDFVAYHISVMRNIMTLLTQFRAPSRNSKDAHSNLLIGD